MLSNGGTASVETACRFPVRLLESGPAAGALAAAYYGKAAGFSDVLSFDMGGTTAKACLIDGGEPLTSTDFEDRKSTRLNSSHANISYAVFCLKKKKSNFRICRPN